MKFYCSILVILLLAIVSCNKAAKFSHIPKITFLSISDTLLEAGKAKMVNIFFNFEDGDGNIGFKKDNLFLIDSRFPNDTLPYPIPEIPEKFDPKSGLKGTIRIEYNGAFLVLRKDSTHLKTDTLVWDIFMKDESNNVSNIIQTPRIILKDSL